MLKELGLEQPPRVLLKLPYLVGFEQNTTLQPITNQLKTKVLPEPQGLIGRR